MDREWAETLVGKTYIDSAVAPADSDSQVVTRSQLPRNVRVLRENDPVTDDFCENRLNLSVDDSGIITKVAYY